MYQQKKKKTIRLIPYIGVIFTQHIKLIVYKIDVLYSRDTILVYCYYYYY